jgi:hypothetical protein
VAAAARRGANSAARGLSSAIQSGIFGNAVLRAVVFCV